jgi:putative ABC transport system permease protein
MNESALRKTKFKDPLGKIIRDGEQELHVIGIIKDFILNNPYESTKPLMMVGAVGWFSTMHVRLNKNTDANQMKKIESLFKKYNSDFPVELKYIDEDYAVKFTDMQVALTLASIFAGLTILISCLGLFGLATFVAENKIKEIGVRKVLGASVTNIVSMLSINFLKLIFVALIFATPLAWWLMSKWLTNYEYRINIEWWVFAIAGGVSILIAFATVFYQAIKAALSNPVKNLRTE